MCPVPNPDLEDALKSGLGTRSKSGSLAIKGI